MNKRIISESKVRSIVRNELKNYLVQEGILDTLKTIGSDVKTTFDKARQQSVFRKSSTPAGTLLADLNYLEVVNAEGIATLVDQLSTTSGVDSTDPLKILDQLKTLISQKVAKQDQDLALEESIGGKKRKAEKKAERKAERKAVATGPKTPVGTPETPVKEEPAKPSPTDVETLTKLYRISASRETNSFNELKSKKPDDPNFLKIKGQYIEYAICKMIIQNLINPALGTDILSKNQIIKINKIIDFIAEVFKTAKIGPPTQR